MWIRTTLLGIASALAVIGVAYKLLPGRAVPADVGQMSQAAWFEVLSRVRDVPDAPLPQAIIRKGSTADSFEAFGAEASPTRQHGELSQETELTYRLQGRLACFPSTYPGCADFETIDIQITKREAIVP